ncbi:MAG: type IV pilus twitching motility protein PilT [Lachnospiraceae bacterium]|nr:type IV pilus twitching motility protein PilT [Lachnospiraceae bacterium]
MDYSVEFLKLMDYARRNNCSDIHLTVGTHTAVRRFGELELLEPIPDPKEVEDMILSILNEDQRQRVLSGKDLDFSGITPDGARMRVNVYHQRNNLAASIRLLENTTPTFANLGLPDVVRKLAEEPRGLILVTGPTGSGKTTTLAAIIDHINKTQKRHVLTIEDPIEYIYPHGKAMIHQREVGRDVDSFATALRSALREDPDIILVGEMRDYETISAAVTAAETGHLVLSTLHTTSAPQTVERIIDACPPHGQNQMRMQLASVLKGVITQQLLPLASDEGRVVATEILLNNEAVGNLIRENKMHQLSSTMQSNLASGMHTLNHDLKMLVMQGKITRDTALQYSTNVKEMQQYM